MDGISHSFYRSPLRRKCGIALALLAVSLLFRSVGLTETALQADEPKKQVVNDHAATTTPSSDPTGRIVPVSEPGNTPQGTGRITGQVLLNEDGGIAAGTTVMLHPQPVDEGWQFSPPPRPPIRAVMVDDQGRFTFDSVAPGRYFVWADRDSQTSRAPLKQGESVELVADGEQPPPLELRLIDGASVSVQVIDKATGKPIPNATIRPGWWDSMRGFRTQGNSPVIIRPLTLENWRFEAWADGYAKEAQYVDLRNGFDAETTIQLVPGGELEGFVSDSEGHPVNDIEMSVCNDETSLQLDSFRSNGSGHYHLKNLPFNRKLTITLVNVDYIEQKMSVILTAPKQNQDVTVTPRPHLGSIVGIVQDIDGRPIADAVLTNMGQSRTEMRRTKSDQRGRFRLDKLFRGATESEVIVRAKTFAPMSQVVESGPVDKPTEVTIVMQPGRHIKGRVIDQTARAVEGVVVVIGYGRKTFSTGDRGTTDKNGRFKFDSLPSDCPFGFHKSGFSSIVGKKLPLDVDDEVEVEMTASGVLLGKVTDRMTGRPIRSFKVRITSSPKQGSKEPNACLPFNLPVDGVRLQSNSGQFRIGDLLAGMPLQVMVEAYGYETATDDYVHAAPQGAAKETEFRMNPVAPQTLRTYRVQLVDAKGDPTVGAHLHLIATRDPLPPIGYQTPFNWGSIQDGQLVDHAMVTRFLKGTTDKEGRFEFSGVPRESHVRLAWWGYDIVSGLADQVRDVRDDETIVCRLPKPASIKGKIDLKLFPPIATVSVSYSDGIHELRSLELQPGQQEFLFENLPAGHCSVSLLSPVTPAEGQEVGPFSVKFLAIRKEVISAGKDHVVNFDRK